MASYSSRVRQDIGRWAEAGLIDQKTADALSRDVESRERASLSFGSILAIMAAWLFGAAILVFVAANWEAIPRIMRVAVLFAIIFVGYVGGAVLKIRDHSAIAEAAWLVAAATFGGSIALIGQMYHLSGDETGVVLVWCIGTAIAAAALRSGPLTMAAVGLSTAWLFLRGVEFWRASDFPHLFIVIAAVLWLISYWTRSVASRHLLLLSVFFYAALMAVEYDVVGIAVLLAAISAALFALAVFLPDAVERIARMDGRLPIHCLIGFLTGLVMIQLELADEDGIGFAIAAGAAFAGIAGAVLLAGRESRGLRWIAYLGFAVELCLVYAVMIGSMLGTAGFFLAAGAILGLLAFAIIRIEKRMRNTPGTVGASA